MSFVKFDAGKLYRVKGEKRDCQVRALCTATDMPYLLAWELLYKVQGELRRCDFTLVESLSVLDPRFSAKRVLPFPAKAGQHRMTGEEFCQRHPKGRFILRLANHVAAVKDGVLFDTWDSTRKCVYTAWEMKGVEV